MNARGPIASHRRARWLVALAVAAFAFRALVPAGYMFAAGTSGAHLVLCPAGLHHSPGHPDASHAGPAGQGGHSGLATEHCPYAVSGGAGLMAALPELPAPFYALLEPSRAPVIESLPASPPPRFHAPRGPPSLS